MRCAEACKASVEAATTIVVSLALIAVVGYFGWWQPAHYTDMRTTSATKRMETTFRTTARKRIAAAGNGVASRDYVGVEPSSIETPDQQLADDDDSNQ